MAHYSNMEDNINDGRLLTLGEASCLVLGMPPTEENRTKAKEIMCKQPLIEVTYVRGCDPMEPFAIGKKLKTLNPYLYKSYPPTPPPDSPTVSSIHTYFDDDGHISIHSSSQEDDYYYGENDGDWEYCKELEENVNKVLSKKEEFKERYEPDDSIIKDEEQQPYSIIKKEEEEQPYSIIKKEEEEPVLPPIEDSNPSPSPAESKTVVLDFLKKVLFVKKQKDVHKYSFMWVTTATQLEIVNAHLNVPKLTAKKLEGWIDKDGFIGKKSLREIKNAGPQYGRYLYVLKQKFRGFIVHS